MKKLYLLILMFACVSAQSATYPDVSSVFPVPSSIKLARPSDDFKATSDPAYKGRNTNIAKTRSAVTPIQNNGFLSKTVSDYRNTNSSMQLDNLESAMGEIIQKIDDDRMKVVKDH
ncbi:MAG: hypothetical protein GY793_07270, partial [Proteobacteria bacterium]|nr:hypothetical protein [Pseudomonadota bacterium]